MIHGHIFHVPLRSGGRQSGEPHVLAHACILSSAEAEAGGWLRTSHLRINKQTINKQPHMEFSSDESPEVNMEV